MNLLKSLNIRVTRDYPSKVYRNDWFEFSTGFQKPCLKISPASYFDTRAMIVISIGWGILFLHLPINSKINDCEYPQYGFYFYGEGTKWWFDTLWICMGYKTKCIHMPWELDWYRTSVLLKNGNWEHEVRGNRKDFYLDEWNDIIQYDTYPYKYICKDGTVQDDILATIKTSQMEWRPRWFKWTSIFSKVRNSIDIRFDKEVGEKRGEWKGGCTGCGYELKKGETPLEALRRMERDRKFD